MIRFFVITLVFILLAIAFTYPLALRMGGAISGFFSTDEPYAALWNFWWVKYSWQNQLNYRNMDMIAAPSGYTYGFSHGYPLFEFINKRLVIFTSNIAAYNFWVLLSFVLSGLTMYYLVHHLARNNPAALLSAVIYAFCPYHFIRSWQHFTLSQIQWMPLFILTLIKFHEKQNRITFLQALAAFSLLLSSEIHYTFFMMIAFALFVAYLIFSRSLARNEPKAWLLLLCIMGLAAVILLLPTPTMKVAWQMLFRSHELKPAVYSIRRPFEDLFLQSAKPLGYLLPSPMHPFFGSFTNSFVGSEWYGTSYTEHVLYLGLIPIGLAFMAAARHFRKPYVAFFVFLAVAAFLFSQPPWWSMGGFKIFMPSYFVYKVFPIIRAYCRFGILLMLAVAVLAGIGFSLKKWRFPAALLLFSGVLFEFWNYPPYKIIDVSKVPAVYYWLKQEPGTFTIAEYPLDINGANEMYRFAQAAHEKKIINATVPGSPANMAARQLTKLSDPKTTAELSRIGVKYVLVHRQGYLKTELVEDRQELEKIPQNPVLKFIRSFPQEECTRENVMCVQKTGPVDVYELKNEE